MKNQQVGRCISRHRLVQAGLGLAGTVCALGALGSPAAAAAQAAGDTDGPLLLCKKDDHEFLNHYEYPDPDDPYHYEEAHYTLTLMIGNRSDTDVMSASIADMMPDG